MNVIGALFLYTCPWGDKVEVQGTTLPQIFLKVPQC
jgi:hypothetical protein